MRRYPIPKTLALFLGVLSVAARSLPEQQPEINVRSPGDVGNSNHRLEESDVVKVSGHILDGNIHTSTYSMFNNTSLPKRDTEHLDISGYSCSTLCGSHHDEGYPDLNDCVSLYKSLQPTPGTITISPEETSPSAVGSCEVLFSSSSDDTTFTYDVGDLAGTVE